MILWLALGLGLFLSVVLALRWYATADPKAVLRALRWAAAIGGAVLLVLVLFGAARQLLALALPLLLPLLARLPALLRRMRVAGPAGGEASEIATRFLRMRLDHDSGAMEGTVLEGPLRGRRLSELSEEEILGLWRDCRAEDEQSAAVLEAYLDRVEGPEWRQAAGGDAAGAGGAGHNRAAAGSNAMSRAEACQILGVAEDADEATVKAAHRRLMQQFHPDHGGSDYLAAKINLAKQVMLGR